MAYRLGVLAGDGIGPEITQAAVRVLEAVQAGDPQVRFEWVSLPIGWEAIRSCGSATPESTLQQLQGCAGWILGPHDSASYPPEERIKLNPSGQLRQRFDLYANIRPARAISGVPAVCPGMDLVVVRENTEEFYTDRNMAWGIGEVMPTPDVVITLGKFSRAACARIARTAFRLAQHRRRKVAVAHKANVIQRAFGLFRDTCREIAHAFPGVTVEEYHIDAMAAHLVRRGQDFDVIVTTNMLGDILSDLTGELSGSLGMAASLNAGETCAMAQAAHGSAPDIAGQGIANPVGLILSAAMLLNWLGARQQDSALGAAARRIERAVDRAVQHGPRTRDLGGTATTTEFTDSLLKHLESLSGDNGVSR